MNIKRIAAIGFVAFSLLLAGILHEKISFTDSYLTQVEKQLSSKNNTFEKLLCIVASKPYSYAFYKAGEDVSVALLDMQHAQGEVHIFGSVPFHSPQGITFGAVESQQLGKFIAFGMISNPKITQVYVNQKVASIIKIDEKYYLWYYVDNSPFDYPLRVTALSRKGETIYQSK